MKFEIYHKCKGGKINAYELFLAKAEELQKENGINCQIFQNSFLADNASKNIREYYLRNVTILQIDSFPERDNINKRIFKSAKISVCIMLSTKKTPYNTYFKVNFWIDKFMKEGSFCRFNYLEIKNFDEKQLMIPNIKNEEKQIFNKYNLNNPVKYSDYFECIEGELNMTFHKKYMTTNTKFPLIVKGAQVQRYFVTTTPSQGEIMYIDKTKYLTDYSKSKKSKHYLHKRVALQGISGANDEIRLIATLINENCFCANSCNYVIKKETDKFLTIEFLLGLFNSKFTNWIFRKSSTNSNVNCYEINNLRLPNLEGDSIVKKIHNVVLNISAIKTENNKISTSLLEQEIDNLVYKLYELTYEEVKVIDPTFELSEQEYESIQL